MTIAEFDHLDTGEKKKLLQQCCGSSAWVDKMLTIPAVEDLVDLEEDAEEKWYECNETDWKEAFAHHPKIGNLPLPGGDTGMVQQWAEGEQSSVKQASGQVIQSLAEANKLYEEKFGYIFIVCATGKSAEEMLGLLTERLQNSPEEEIKFAMEEQLKITKLRLEKLFND